MPPSYLFILTSSNQMYSGTGTVIFDWIRYARNDFDFSVLMDSQNTANFEIMKNFCRKEGVSLYESAPFSVPGCPDPGVNDISSHLDQHHYDYIECISWANTSTNMTALSCIPPETRLLFSPLSQPIWTLPDHQRHYLVASVFRKMLESSDAVFTISPSERDLPEFLGIDPTRVHFVGIGLDIRRYGDVGAHKPYTVLCVADFREPRKRADLLLASFEKALEREPQLKLILAGKGSDTLPISGKILPSVSRLGYVDDNELIRLYQEAALFVLISDYEAFGIPIAEALCCGTPVLINNQKELVSLFGDLPGVTWTQNSDTTATADKIVSLASHGHRSDNISLSALSKFSFENTYGKKRALIYSLLSRKRLNSALKKLKILHVSPTYYSAGSVVGGGEKYIMYMCKAMKIAAPLTGTNLDTSILSFGDKPGLYSLDDGLPCEVMNGQPWNPYSIEIRELNDKIDSADIIFVHQCLSAFGLFVASHGKLRNKFVIGTDHGGGEHRIVSHTREIGRIFDFFHAQSLFAANSFKDIEGQVEVVAGPVDTTYYLPDPSKQRNKNMVVAVGRLLPHKGFERIIRVLPKDLGLVIIGGQYDKAYRKHLDRLSRGAHVTLLEHLTDDRVLEYLQKAGLFVHASTHMDYSGRYYHKPELLGLAPLEALSCGTPTLVSSAGALPELAAIRGCLKFANDDELAQLLHQYSASSVVFPPSDEIHRDVEEKYGLLAFGKKLMGLIYRQMEHV